MNLKTRLNNGESIIGTMVSLFDTPQVALVMKSAGFDFFIVDCEHGPFDSASLARILVLAKEAEMPALVRIPEPRREVILKAMEGGAKGILLPNAETVEQAQLLVDYSKYAPLGKRGVAVVREHTGFKRPENVPAYMRESNDETMLMLQIESPTGLKNLPDMLDIEGIDVAFVGPSDLSQSMGIMGQMDHPDFVAALESIIETAERKGKVSGVHLMDVDRLNAWKAKGMRCNMYGSDVSHILSGAGAGLKALR